MSGSQLIGLDTGSAREEMEYSSKALDNTVCALVRHTSALQRPDKECLREFREMSRECISDICGEILAEKPQCEFFMMDYPKGQS